MVQRTVLKVDISCQKCKRKLLKAVSGLQGVDKVEVDVAKGTLTVTGDADPYQIIVRTRKSGQSIEVMSIGPPPAPPKPAAATDGGGGGSGGGGGQKKPDEKNPDDKKAEQAQHNLQIHTPHTCPICEQMYLRVGYRDEPNTSCSIM